MSWLIEQFVDFSGSLPWCLLVYLHLLGCASYMSLGVFLPEASDSQPFVFCLIQSLLYTASCTLFHNTSSVNSVIGITLPP